MSQAAKPRLKPPFDLSDVPNKATARANLGVSSTADMTAAIATAKSEAISTASTDATTKANAAQAAAIAAAATDATTKANAAQAAAIAAAATDATTKANAAQAAAISTASADATSKANAAQAAAISTASADATTKANAAQTAAASDATTKANAAQAAAIAAAAADATTKANAAQSAAATDATTKANAAQSAAQAFATAADSALQTVINAYINNEDAYYNALAVHITGIESIAGQKTFTTGPTSFNAATHGLEIGSSGTSNTPYIDFHSAAANNDYDVRIIASGGSAAGTGTLNVQGGDFQFNGSQLMTRGAAETATGAKAFSGGLNINNGSAAGGALTLGTGLNSVISGADNGSVLTINAAGYGNVNVAGGGLSLAGDPVSTRGAAETLTGAKTFTGAMAIGGSLTVENNGGTFFTTKDTSGRAICIRPESTGSMGRIQFTNYAVSVEWGGIGVTAASMDMATPLLTVNSDPVMTRGATETITGVKGFPSGCVFGNGSGSQNLSINGGNSGTAAGPLLQFNSAGSVVNAIGHYSAIIGGAYDSSLLIYGGAGAIYTYAGGKQLIYHAGNLPSVATQLGYTPANKAGETFTGAVIAPSMQAGSSPREFIGTDGNLKLKNYTHGTMPGGAADYTIIVGTGFPANTLAVMLGGTWETVDLV